MIDWENGKEIKIYKKNETYHIDGTKICSDDELLHILIESMIFVYDNIVKEANKEGFLKTMELYYDKKI